MIKIEMVSIEGGNFLLGGKVSVNVSNFQIGKYPVTQKQWREIMGNNPSHFKGDDCPVEQVSWNDVQDFIAKLNQQTGLRYRLPTEAEWEYAARGGAKSKGFLYAGGNDLDKVAWYEGNSNDKTHPVGSKAPNELGLHDISGNVWEWCEDDWHINYQGAPTDGRAWVDSPRGDGRVLRGGSWDDYAELCRAAYRNGNAPAGRNTDVGFRLAM